MNKDDYLDDDFDFEMEEESSHYRKSGKQKKHGDAEWDDEAEDSKRGKKKTRWRDIEERLARKELRKNSTCDYEDYVL